MPCSEYSSRNTQPCPCAHMLNTAIKELGAPGPQLSENSLHSSGAYAATPHWAQWVPPQCNPAPPPGTPQRLRPWRSADSESIFNCSSTKNPTLNVPPTKEFSHVLNFEFQEPINELGGIYRFTSQANTLPENLSIQQNNEFPIGQVQVLMLLGHLQTTALSKTC